MAHILLGPILRYVDQTTAAVWVETDTPCRVSILDAEADTFTVHGHHYALVEVTGLAPGSDTEYTVSLDGEVAWPFDESLPPSVIRTLGTDDRHRLLVGSCRTSVAHDRPSVATHGVDMLRAYAHQLLDGDDSRRPHVMLLLGDQVYADEPPEAVREFIRSRRDTGEEPGEEIADYTEYARLYRHAWSDSVIRWLLSTVSVSMMFDDHDLRDDWNTSAAWREEMIAKKWWRRRVVAGLGSYWVYQHLGNLSPSERAEDPVYKALRDAEGDAADILDDFAWRADEDSRTYRWSYARDFGGHRLIMLDSRCGRVLTPGARRILDPDEWEWFDSLARGDVDQLLIGSSLPVMLPSGLHYVESWNEAVCDGAWGARAARIAERIRQAIDLEHWAAFRGSFDEMAHIVKAIARGRRGRPPAGIVFLSGDVHYSYIAKARVRKGESKVYQLVCSPIRNPLNRIIRFANGAASFIGARLLGWALARTAGVHRSPISWRIKRGPWFENAVALVDLDGRSASVSWHGAEGDLVDRPTLTTIAERRLT